MLQRANVMRGGPRRVARLRLVLRSLARGRLQIRWSSGLDPRGHLLDRLQGSRLLLLLLLRLLWLLLLLLLVLLHCSDLCERVHFLLLLPLEVDEVREGSDRDASSGSDGERRCI